MLLELSMANDEAKILLEKVHIFATDTGIKKKLKAEQTSNIAILSHCITKFKAKLALKNKVISYSKDVAFRK